MGKNHASQYANFGSLPSDPGNIQYSPHVVFRYNTGAIGNLKFPGKEEYLQSRKIR